MRIINSLDNQHQEDHSGLMTQILLHFKIWKLDTFLKKKLKDCRVCVEYTSRQVIFLTLGLAFLGFRKLLCCKLIVI